jgi:transcription elongation factor Elf1
MPISEDLPVTLMCARCRSTAIGTLAADRGALVICENCGHEFRVSPPARARGWPPSEYGCSKL